MSSSAVVREAWELYKGHWRAFIPLAVVVYLIIGVVAAILVALLGWVGGIIAFLISIVGLFWLQGAYVEAVRDVRDGKQDLSLAETFARVRPRLPAIIPAGLLATIAIGLAAVTIIGIPLALFLLTIWVLIVPVIVLEGRSAGESFGRSREIVRGNGWNVFGVIVITIAIFIVVNLVVTIITAVLPDGVAEFIRSVVSNAIVGPFVAVAWNLIYWALTQRATATAPAAPGEPPPPPPPPAPPPA